jgi:hypothetical protein
MRSIRRRRREPASRWRDTLSRLRYQRYSTRLRHRVLAGVGLLVGLGAVWILVTGYLAHQQAKDLAGRLREVKVLIAQGRVDDARRLGHDLPAMAERTRHLTSGPAWWIGAHVPVLGAPLDSARTTADVVAGLGGQVVPELLGVAKDLDPARLRRDGRTIALAPLAAAAPTLADAGDRLDRAARRLAGGGSWLSSFDVGRAALRGQVEAVRGYVDAAARVAQVFPPMLGQEGTQRYFIALQNEAELRGTGGLPGAFAIASVTGGRVRFERFASDSVLLPARTHHVIDTGLDLGPEFAAMYGASDPTRLYTVSNLSPDFRAAARIWAAMYRKVSGTHVNGVIALDPTALSYFLAATGPATVPGHHGAVSAANVVQLTQRDEYALYPDNLARKRFLVALLKAAATRLTSGAGAPVALLQAATRSAGEQRLLVWHEDPSVERALEQTGYGGTFPPAADRRPFSAVIVNNAAAGKLDYYLHRSVTYSSTGCGARRDVVVTITLTNSAPATGLPPYVTTRLDNAPAGARPGDNRSIVDYFATPGARLQSVTLDGRASAASVHGYLGHEVFRMDVELPRGRARTITLHLDEPARSGPPRIWRQPGVTPIDVQAFSQKCG